MDEVFPWREWHATTDAAGRARIEDLPPNDALWVSASHAAHRMTRADRDNFPSAKLVSGRTAAI